MANDHVDSALKIDAPSMQTATPEGKTERKAIDNDAQAAEVEQRRELAAGGGDDAIPATEAPAGAAAAAIERATQRVRATDRPSPFGVAQFPPLPQP